MKAFLLILGIPAAMAGSGMGGENSAQRLDDAQQGMAEPSWPRKPDGRLSSLSGKMKDTQMISPKAFGQEKEFRARRSGEWNTASRAGAAARWEGGSPRNWEQTLWNQKRDWSNGWKANQDFRLAGELTAARERDEREIKKERAQAPDWSARSSRLAGGGDGSLRRYEGRLTRVRERVLQEERGPRDLGPERQERFRPEEVQKMLSQPVGEFDQQARAQSPSASPLAAADN